MFSTLKKENLHLLSHNELAVCKHFQFGQDYMYFCHLVELTLSQTSHGFYVSALQVLKLFTKQQNFRLAPIKSICRAQNEYDLKIEISPRKGTKHCGKVRKCWKPAFSPFSTMFSKALFFRVVKSRDCLVKS